MFVMLMKTFALQVKIVSMELVEQIPILIIFAIMESAIHVRVGNFVVREVVC